MTAFGLRHGFRGRGGLAAGVSGLGSESWPVRPEDVLWYLVATKTRMIARRLRSTPQQGHAAQEK